MLRQRADIEVVGLLTTFNAASDRVAMHAVRRELAEMQARAVGLPLVPVQLPWPCSNDAYESAMRSAFENAVRKYEIQTIAFGDLFLADIRAYREEQMANWNLVLRQGDIDEFSEL